MDADATWCEDAFASGRDWGFRAVESALATWDSHIQSLCLQVGECADAIAKRYPQYAA